MLAVMPTEQRRLLVAKMVKKGMSTALIASKMRVPVSTIRTDRLMISVPNPEEVAKEAHVVFEPMFAIGDSYSPAQRSRRLQIAKMHRDGKTQIAIAKSLKISKMTVRRDLMSLGLLSETTPQDVKNARHQDVKRMIDSGASDKEIMEELDISRQTILRDRAALGYGHSRSNQDEEMAARRIKVKALIEAGKDYKQIAAELDIASMTVARDCESMQIGSSRSKNKHSSIVQNRRAAVKEHFESGLTCRQIARTLGVTEMTVRRDLKAQGISVTKKDAV